ncbi:twin-arginine translocase TatA/TatE family subunit [Streptomyces broussonetiae]|uniref:Twin-arginine translocase TatA/TatE family subunit n=2 Tax=Streptomyces broussonetiae TaxID=2686304 RepID=A0A6I6NGM7_9ACTN|nr:twin-arginine translocase TatA/TatE family subunit [Streptomyces broussonetiae]
MFRNGLQPWQLLLVAVAIILLSAAKKLPETARGLGRSLRSLKSGAKAMKGEDVIRSSAAEDGGASAEPALRIIRETPTDTATGRPATERNRAC